jgi:hypothetical protein
MGDSCGAANVPQYIVKTEVTPTDATWGIRFETAVASADEDALSTQLAQFPKSRFDF